MSSINESIQSLNQTLTSIKWHSALAPIVQELSNTFPSTPLTIDNLLSATTKLVETYLKEAVQDFTKATIPSDQGFGVELLNYAKTKGFVPENRRGNRCIFSLLYWYFEKPRNIIHHSFTLFPMATILMIISSTNSILDEIDNLRSKYVFYDANKNVEQDEASNIISVTITDIKKDEETIVPQTLNMFLVNPDKSTETYPLLNQGNNTWNARATTYGKTQGTYRIDFAGFDNNHETFNISGSHLLIVKHSH